MLSSESPVNVELDGKEQSDSFGLQLDEATEDTNKQDSHDDDAHTAEEQIDEKEKDLQYLHETKCFEGFESISMSYIWTSQLTCSNVMSTKITVYPFEDNSTSGINRKKPSSSFLGGGGGKTTGASTVASSLLCRATSQTELSGNQETFHIYSQAFSSNRSKQKASTKKSIGNFKSNLDHQAQLPSFRRSLPALPVPVNRLNQELLNERDRFMKHLLKEREEKKILENWAATKVQALYRSYSVRRPRQKKAAITRRQRLNTLTNIRIDLTKMHETLVKHDILSLPAAPLIAATTASVNHGNHNSIFNSLKSDWRKDIQERASNKREAKHRKDRMHHAATKIQACVKRFLARIGYLHLFTRHHDEIYLAAIIKVQSVYNGYRVRCKIAKIVERLQREAAIQIQCLIRGITARERVSMIRFDYQSRHYEQNVANGDAQTQISSPSHHPLYSFPRKYGRSTSSTVTKVSSLRPLYMNRKSRQAMEFKTTKWYEERVYLCLHKLSVRLHHKKDILLATWYYQESLQQKKKKSSSPVTRRNSPKNRSRRLTRRKTVRDVKITENTLCSNSSSNISSGVFNLSPEQRKSKQMIHPISSCPQLEKMSLAS